jgi:hypothetical protein
MANSTKATTGHPQSTIMSLDAITSPRQGMPISSILSRALLHLHRLHIAFRLFLRASGILRSLSKTLLLKSKPQDCLSIYLSLIQSTITDTNTMADGRT